MPCKCQNYWIRCICYALNGVENIRMTKTISKAKGFKSTMVLGVRSFFLNGIVLFPIGKFKYFCAPLRNFFFYCIFFCFSVTFSPLNLQGWIVVQVQNYLFYFLNIFTFGFFKLYLNIKNLNIFKNIFNILIDISIILTKFGQVVLIKLSQFLII